MAKGLDVSVVAEGVENELLARMLTAAGCNELQGYYFGRPGALTAIQRDQPVTEGVTEAA